MELNVYNFNNTWSTYIVLNQIKFQNLFLYSCVRRGILLSHLLSPTCRSHTGNTAAAATTTSATAATAPAVS